MQETRGILLGLHVPKAGLDAARPDDKLLKMVPEQSAFEALDLTVLDRLVVKQRVELNRFVRRCTVFILENRKLNRCQDVDLCDWTMATTNLSCSHNSSFFSKTNLLSFLKIAVFFILFDVLLSLERANA